MRTSSPTSAVACTCCRGCDSVSRSRRCGWALRSGSTTPSSTPQPRFAPSPCRRPGRRRSSATSPATGWRRRWTAPGRSGSSGLATASKTIASASSTSPSRARRWHFGGRYRPAPVRRRGERSALAQGRVLAAQYAPVAGAARRRGGAGGSWRRCDGRCAGGGARPANRLGRCAVPSPAPPGCEVGWALTKLAPNVPFNVEIGPGAASAGRAPSSPTSSRSRTPSAAASTTSHSRSRPGRCAAGCTTAMSAPTGSSCGRWSRSRSAPRTSTVSSATG